MQMITQTMTARREKENETNEIIVSSCSCLVLFSLRVKLLLAPKSLAYIVHNIIVNKKTKGRE